MRHNYLVFFSILYIFLFLNYSNALENKILLKLNNKIITSIDLNNEIKILKLLNQNIVDLNKKQIAIIATKSLKKQVIKEIELSKYNKELDLPENYLNPYLLRYAKKLNFETKEEFFNYCKVNSIDIELIKKKIIIDLLWNQFIYQKFSKNVKIDKNIIKNSILKKEFIDEYLLFEIIFDIKNKNNLKNKYEIIKRNIIKEGFEKTALTHSISDTSKTGGKLGWIKETSLSPTIKNILKKTNIKTYTKPIQIPGGFIILYVEDIQKVKSNLNIDKEIENSIKIRTNKQLEQFSNIYLNKIMKDLKINEL